MESTDQLYVTIVMCRVRRDDIGDYDRPVIAFFDPVAAAEWIADNEVTPESSPYYTRMLPVADAPTGPESISVSDLYCSDCAEAEQASNGAYDTGIYCCDEERELYAVLGDLVVALQGVPGPVFGPARP